MDNSFPWSVLLSTVEIMSKCLKLKCNHELQASGFTAKFGTFHLFVWNIFIEDFLGKLCTQEREKQIAPPSGHFYVSTLVELSPISTNQRMKNHSVMVKYVIYFHFTLFTACFWFCEFSVSYIA